MKAFTLDALGTAPALRGDVPDPLPVAGEVLVRVHASSVNPVDNAIAAGMLEGMVEHEFPVTLGRDYAGVVEAVGADVTRYAEGDAVYGFLPHADPAVHAGTWAEWIVVPEDRSIARAPDGIDLTTAGAGALAGMTALGAFDALALTDGDVVLIAGAAGGVGSLAVQLAAQAGATVLAPALPEDEELLRELGVAEVLDRDDDIAVAVRERYPDGVDAVLDVVSYAPGAYDAILRPGGRLSSPNSAAGEGPGRANVMAERTTEGLERLGGLLADGTLVVPIRASYELDRAGEALRALATEHTQGKLAVRVA